ncbi:MAG: DNA recombination protein RmuC [Syntrophomonadaceae bacterium]|nr:DNA recombination protein RmuC [Syntrophomonadaceae bacterium]
MIMLLLAWITVENRNLMKKWRAEESESRAEVEVRLDTLGHGLDNSWRMLREELSSLRNEHFLQARQGREESALNLKIFSDSLLTRLNEIALLQKNQLSTFAEELNRLIASNEQRLETMRQTMDARLKYLQEDNSLKLEQMRMTVDEKLHATLETRLGESFKLVSERLEMVYKGLGEMQNLAAGVGDLKKVLTNVKTRGIWGEIQLANILEQVLSPEQYSTNVATRPGCNERVEFAVRLPGLTQDENPVWLPIDAKFPQEDYLRLVEAQEQGRADLAEEAGRQLERRIKLEAKMVEEKYLDPPHTTDFGIIFLPTESLYAEVVRRPGLLAGLQNDSRVIVAGPSNMLALLNSLAVGFRTLAIEKRSSEVWQLLGLVKTEFGTFGDALEKTKKKLEEASTSIDSASRRSRSIERRLRAVQEFSREDERLED